RFGVALLVLATAGGVGLARNGEVHPAALVFGRAGENEGKSVTGERAGNAQRARVVGRAALGDGGIEHDGLLETRCYAQRWSAAGSWQWITGMNSTKRWNGRSAGAGRRRAPSTHSSKRMRRWWWRGP